MQRKVFRIEKMFAAARAPAKAPAAAPAPKATPEIERLMRELDAVYEIVGRSKQELIALRGNSAEGPRIPRAQQELSAAVSGTETATQKILKSAEGADECARNLIATLKDDYKRGLAQDIQDHVVKIYEACNFQDVTGQRINNAVATLQAIEQGLARVFEIWGGIEQFHRHALPPAKNATLVNGPKLDNDAGHASQHDIDRIFA